MCIATGVSILNGMSINDCNGKITFYNKNGTSVIDYSIVDKHFCDSIQDFHVGHFNSHVPIFLSLLKQSIVNMCTCNKASNILIYEWNDDEKER